MVDVNSLTPRLPTLEKELYPRFLSVVERERIRICVSKVARRERSGRRWDVRPARSCGSSPRTLSRAPTGRMQLTGRCGGAPAASQGPQVAHRWSAAGLRQKEAASALVAGADLPRSTQRASRRSEHAGERGNDLPGVVLSGPRRSETGSPGRGPHRPDPA